ncbi:MAG: helix-turn-helix domain-containing protein [Massiliimalia sp.]|jgi:transcriptional regulator with XRE-family HTH domain
MYPNIEAERSRQGLTKEGLANKLGISSRTYYNWQSGKSAIPSSKLIEMSKLFRVSIEYLLKEERK